MGAFNGSFMMIKKEWWLRQTLILSLGMNVLLLLLFFYLIFFGTAFKLAYCPAIKSRGADLSPTMMKRLSSLDWNQLIFLLEDKHKIDSAYAVRDFALAALAAFHYLELPLNYKPFGKGLPLFKGLRDADFEKIKDFIQTTKYPLTTEGLFLLIQKEGIKNCDADLLTYFCHKPEFLLLETLFARSSLPLQRKQLLELAIEGGWELLAHYYQRQLVACQFDATFRHELLLNYSKAGSKMALQLLKLDH
jgi:hypothetical protein